MTTLAINTNLGSITATRNMSVTARKVNQSIGRLSSGLRIQSARDDAAGIAVSDNLRANIRSLEQAQRNANDAVAILQTAEGAYSTVVDILIRMRELAVQSASDGLTDTERGYLDTEFTQLIGEIDRISDVTEYNGIKLLDGTAGAGGTMTFQVGARNTGDDRITIALADQDSTALAVDTLQVDILSNAQSSIDAIDTALSSIADDRATIGSIANQLTMAVDNLGIAVENLSTANSQIRDVDVASESANFAKANVLMQAGVAILTQANQQPQLALRLLG